MLRIKVLDSLRGLASFVVLFHHLFTRMPRLFSSASSTAYVVMKKVSDFNVEAVVFFFILSGFSIRLSLKNDITFSKEKVNDYIYRRFKRILPLYFIALIVTFLVGLIMHRTTQPDFNMKTLLGNICFLQISKSYNGFWFAPYGDNGPLWSLSFEMFYYLFFPFFIIALNKIFKNKLLNKGNFIASLIVAFIISIIATYINKQFFFPYIAFATLFYSWYVGFFIAHLYMKGNVKLGWEFCVLSVCTVAFGIIYMMYDFSTPYKLFVGGIMSILIFVVLYLLKTPFIRVLKIFEVVLNTLFYEVGKGSYALYLLHYPVLLLMVFYKFDNLLITTAVFLLSMIMCKFLEEWLVHKKFSFLKLKYWR